MATSRTLKNRIRSTKNIEQITKAMQAVSAVKMRRSEQAAIKSRPYALAALEILKNVRRALKEEETASTDGSMIEEREIKKTCLVVVTSDKGLAGSFNSNVLRASAEFLKNSKVPVDIVAIGKRGRDFWSRRGKNVVKDFSEAGDFISVEETLPIAEFLNDLYRNKQCDEVIVVYTNFLSALKQTVVVRKILPVTVEALEQIIVDIIPEHGLYSGMPKALEREPGDREDKGTVSPYLFEPSPAKVLNKLIPLLVSIELHQSILEANASEHSSRMVAMKNASENASELIDTLGITYNKLRQAAITKELTEISAGTEALSNN